MAYEILSDKKKTQITELVNTTDGLKLQQFLPETSADITSITNIDGVSGSNVQEALESIQENINAITGVAEAQWTAQRVSAQESLAPRNPFRK